MIKTVNTYSVISAFSSENTHIYRIPKYQREYTWGMKEWDALFNDIVENDEGYFLGSFICVSSGALNNAVELIDGQQRFTTLSIFLLSLYVKLSAFKDEFDDDEMTEYNNLKNQIANKAIEGLKIINGLDKYYQKADNYGKANLLRLVGAKYILTKNNEIIVEYKEPFNAIYHAKKGNEQEMKKVQNLDRNSENTQILDLTKKEKCPKNEHFLQESCRKNYWGG